MSNKQYYIDELEEVGKLASKTQLVEWRILFKFLFIICGILVEFKLDDRV